MNKLSSLLLITSIASSLALAGTVNFDEAKPGNPPPGWSATITGKGDFKWTVETSDLAASKPNVLKQSAIAPKPSFPLCVKKGTSLKDGFVEAKFRSVTGKIDQAGGVIWRCLDKDNYYICRANALEDNVVLYKLENGKRKSLPIVGRRGGYGVDEKVAPRTWHTLRVEFSGNQFTVIFNAKKLFVVEDETFKGAGRVGLWTKADSVTLFDDFKYGAK